MAAVDLEDLIPDLVYSLSAPGEAEYDTVSPEEWVSRMRDAFWNAYNDGLLRGYRESDGSILPRSGSETMPRDEQQLIILYTGIAVLRSKLLNLQTVFRTKAGPVEYEVQQSAQIAKALLDDLSQRRTYILDRLAETEVARGIFVIDLFNARQQSINENITSWVGD